MEGQLHALIKPAAKRAEFVMILRLQLFKEMMHVHCMSVPRSLVDDENKLIEQRVQFRLRGQDSRVHLTFSLPTKR